MSILRSSVQPDFAAGVADWRDRICSAFVDLECENAEKEGFFGTATSQHLDRLQFSRVHSTRQRVVRSAARLHSSNSDDFLLSIQMNGRGYVRQGGREAYQEAGDLALYDTTRPYELEFDGRFRQLILTLLRDAMLRAIPMAEDLTAMRICRTHGSSRLAAGYLRTLANQCHNLDVASRPVARDTVFDMLSLAFSPVRDMASPQRGLELLYHRALGLIGEQLPEARLCPAYIAKSLGVSVNWPWRR